MTRILLVQGHPDHRASHLCHALASAYADGARDGGHEVRLINVGKIEFPLLRSQHEWEHEPLPPSLQQAQEYIHWAEHLVLFFPLWLGDMPALLKGFLEQVARPGFAFGTGERNAFTNKGLTGRSARVVVTMGMPACTAGTSGRTASNPWNATSSASSASHQCMKRWLGWCTSWTRRAAESCWRRCAPSVAP